MSKTAKIILIVLAVPIVVIAGVAIFLKVYFTQDRLKALIIPKVESAIQRDVAVGKVSLKLFPNLAIKMASLEISGPRQGEFANDEFLKVDEIVLDVGLKPLLRREMQVDKVIITHPQVYLEVNKDGINNYTFPTPPPPPGKAPAPPSGKPFALFLSDFQLSDGVVEYVDYQGDTRFLISDLDQELSMQVTGGGKDAAIETQATIGGFSFGSPKRFLISNLPVSNFERLSYKSGADLLTIDSARIGLREIALSARGSIANMSKQPMLDLSIQSTQAELSQLLSLVPPEFLKASEGLQTAGKVQFALTVKGVADSLNQPEVKGSFTLHDGSIRYSALPKSITNVNVSGSFEQTAGLVKKPAAGRLDVDKLSATLGSNPISGKLSVVNFADPTVNATFSGSLNLAEVKDYYPLEKGTDLSGLLKANVTIVGRAMDAMNMKASGQLDFQNVMIQTPSSQKPLRNLNGTIVFNNQLIDAKQLSLNIGQSDLALSFTMRNYLGMVMKDAPPSGKPALSATLKSRLLRTADLMGSSESAKADSGKPAAQPMLPDMDVDANVSIDKLIAEKFEFNNARGSVKIRNGVITLDNFFVNAFQGSVTTKGTLDMRPNAGRAFNLDLNINAVEANALLPNFTSFGSHLFGRFSMTTKLQGTLNDTLGLETKTLGGNGNVSVNQGRLVGYPMTSELANFTGVSEFRELNFASLANNFQIANGRLSMGDLKFSAQKSDFVLSGSQGLDGSLDYKLLVKLPPELSGKLKISGLGSDLLDFLKDKDGKLNLNFLVKGTASKPAFALDTKQIEAAAKAALQAKAKAELDKQTDAAKKKLEEELKKKQDELLKNIFGK